MKGNNESSKMFIRRGYKNRKNLFPWYCVWDEPGYRRKQIRIEQADSILQIFGIDRLADNKLLLHGEDSTLTY